MNVMGCILQERNAPDGGGFERAVRVTRWFDRHPRATWRDVSARWGVSRATAYRWLATFRAVGVRT